MNYQYILLIVAAISIFSSCEDPIDVQLSPTNGQVNVDAWLTNESIVQTIKLRRVSPYFVASPSPVISGATVFVTDDLGNEFNFVEIDQSGNYAWTPTPGESIGEVGRSYSLDIDIDGKLYNALSEMKRIMPIDSLITTFKEEELGQVEGIYAEVFARDFVGPGDTYWIKTFKNGNFLNKPGEINIVYDASFTAGGGVDGVTFISPIRNDINRESDPDDAPSGDTDDLAPWAVGDSIRVEIHSLNESAFYFMEESLTQMTLGDAALFAEPPANVPSNITPLNPITDADQAVGFFNVSAVTSAGYIIK